MEADKFIKKSVSARESVFQRAEERAKITNGGNLSGYVSSLIEKDLSEKSGSVDAVAPSILVDLTRRLLGELDAAEMALLCRGQDQPRKLQGMLRALLAAEATQDLPMAAEEQAPYGQPLVGRVETDLARNVIAANDDFIRLCGHSREEILGRNLGQILQGAATEPDAISKLRAALEKRQAVHVQITNHHKDGSTYRVDLSIRPTATGFSGEARPLFRFATASDVTAAVDAQLSPGGAPPTDPGKGKAGAEIGSGPKKKR